MFWIPNAAAASNPHTEVRPGKATTSLTGRIPVLVVDRFIAPAARALAITGLAPNVRFGSIPEPAAASLVLSGQAPVILVDEIVLPNAAALAVSGQVPVVIVDQIIAPAVASLALTGQVPKAFADIVVTPGVDALVLSGQVPTIVNTTTYRYFRWSVTKTEASRYLSFALASIKVGATSYPTSSMTSNTAPSPLVASASSNFSGYFPWEAFNGNDADGQEWIVSSAAPGSGVVNEWLKIDLGSGNGINPTAYTITRSYTTTRSPPVDWTFEGSNDDTNWDELDSQTGISSGWTAGTPREFTI